MSTHILAIDQGTTSSRAVVFTQAGKPIGIGQSEFTQHFPKSGWVEHDAMEIWQTTLNSCQQALSTSKINGADIRCIGITNQRETTIVWDRATGLPIYNAIVWQDRRTSSFCDQLKHQGLGELVQEKTGLLIDSYFSATKVKWILDNVENARQRAENGELAFGTVDSFLLWHLTGGKSHFTDATNASRTMLFNIHDQTWDAELLELFDIPNNLLPVVKDCADDFGITTLGLLGAEIPITGIIGDQQAAAFGQGCFQAGMAKSTYGTGCFVLANTGDEAVKSEHQLLTTVAYRLDGKTSYAVEGSIFMAGATLQWIRDGIGLIKDAAETEVLAQQSDPDSQVYLVPAFTGLGAPYWDADARGALYGLTRGTGIAEIVSAALMSVCFQTKDLMLAMEKDGAKLSQLRVDGGMVANTFFAQKLADILNCSVLRPVVIETTALGAAYAAGLQAGLYESTDTIAAQWQLDTQFSPQCEDQWRETQYNGWIEAVKRTRSNLFDKPPKL
jgi:glycerol kinase